MEEESRLKLESLLDSEEKKILSERELRSLELRAYGALLTAFRAGGDLDEEKRDTLSIVRQNLKISEARHKLEVRRVATDPLLCRISDAINGFNTVQDWRDEGFIELPSEKVINRLSTRSLSRRIKNEEEEEENERRGRDEEIEPWRRHPTRVRVHVDSILNVSPTLKRHQKVKKTIKELTAANLKTQEPSSLSISSRFKNIQNGWGNINKNSNVIMNNNIDDDGADHSEDSDIDNNKLKMTPLLTHLKQVAKLHEMEKKAIDSSSDSESSQEISIESLKRKGKLKFVTHKRPLKQLKEKQVTARRKSQQQQLHQYPQHVNQPLQHHQQQPQQQPQQQQQQLLRKPKSPAKLQKLHLKKQKRLQQKRQFVGDKNLPTNLQVHRASPDIIDAPISPVKSGGGSSSINISNNNNNVTNTMNVVATNISIQNESRIYDVPRGPKRKSSKSSSNTKSKLGITKRFKKIHHLPQQQQDRVDDQGDDEDEEEEERNDVYTKSLIPTATTTTSSSSNIINTSNNNNRKVLHKVKIRRKPKISMNDRIRHLKKEDELPDSPSSSDLRNEYHHPRSNVIVSRLEMESLHPNYHNSDSSSTMYPRPPPTSGSRRGLSKTRGARGTVGSRRGTSRGRGRNGKGGGTSRSSHDQKQNQRTVKPRINQSKRKQLDEIRVELKSESESDIEQQQHHRNIEKELFEKRMAAQKNLDLEHQLTMRRLANLGNKSGDIDLDMDAELDEFEKMKLARMNISSTRLRTPDRIDNERGNIKSPEKYPKYINERGANYDQIPSSSTTTTIAATMGENKIPQRNSKDRSPLRKPIKKYIKSDNDDEMNIDDDKSDEEDHRNHGKDNYHRSSRENSKTPTPEKSENGGDSSSSQSHSQSKQQQRESSPASSTTSEKDNSSSTSSKSKIATPSKIPVVPRAPLPAPVFSTSLDKETFNKKRQKILQNFTSGADALTSSTTASSLARRAPIFSSTASSPVVGGGSASGTTTSTVSGTGVLTKPPGILPQRKAQPHILVNSKAQRNLNAAAAAANVSNNNTSTTTTTNNTTTVGVGNLTSSTGVIGVSGVTTLVSSSNSVINTTSIINGTSISSIGINNSPGVPSLMNQGLTTTGTSSLVGSNTNTILATHHQQQQQQQQQLQTTTNLSSLSSMTNAIPVTRSTQGANIIFLQKAGGGSSTTVTSQIGGLSTINNPMTVGALGMQHAKKAIIMRRPLNLPNRQGNVMILDVPKNPNQVISPQYLQTARILSSSGDLTLLAANYQNQGGINPTTVRKIMGAQVSTTPSLSSAASSSIVSPSITSSSTLSLNQGSGNFSVNQVQMNLSQQHDIQQQPTVISCAAGGPSKIPTKRLNRVFPPKDVIKVSSSMYNKQQQQQILSVPISTKDSIPSLALGNNLQIQLEPETIQMIPEVEAPYYEEEVVTTSVVSSLPNNNDNNTTNIIPASLTFPSPIKIPTNNNSSSSSLSVGGNVLSFNITKDNIGDSMNMNVVAESEIVVENSLNLFESCMSDNGNYPSSSSDPTNLPNLIISNSSGNNNASNLSLPSSSSHINNNNNSTNNQIIDPTGEISGYVMTNSRQNACILSTTSSSGGGRVDSNSSLSLSNNNLQHNQQPDSSTINLIQRPIPTSTSTPNITSFEQEEFNFDGIVEMDVESETIVQSNHESDINPDATATHVVLIDNSVLQPDIISGEHYVTISTTPSSSSMAISQSQSSDVSSSLPLTEDIFSTALNRSGINFTDLNEEGNVANLETVVTFQEPFPFVSSEGQIKTTYTTE